MTMHETWLQKAKELETMAITEKEIAKKEYDAHGCFSAMMTEDSAMHSMKAALCKEAAERCKS